MKNQALELHSPLPKSFKVYKERTMEKRKIEDRSCSLLSHFWSTFRSPFFTFYIPFQISRSQESTLQTCFLKVWMLCDGFDAIPWKFLAPEVISYELFEGEVFNSKFCINPLEPISMVASNGAVAGEGATSTVKQPLRVTCDLHHKFEMEIPHEDQSSHYGHEKDKFAYLSMRDRIELGKRQVQQSQWGSKDALNEDMSMKAKLASMARRIEEFELRNCPTIPTVRDMCGYQSSYTLSWNDHPNLTTQPQPQPSMSTSSLEQAILKISKVMEDFVGEQQKINSHLNEKIDNMESSINVRMEGVYNDLSLRIEKVQDSIEKLTNLDIARGKGSFLLNPTITFKEPMQKIKESVQDDKGLPNPLKHPLLQEEKRNEFLGPNGKDANFVWDPGGIQHEVGESLKNRSYGENKPKTGEKNQDSAIFAQHFLLCEIFARHIPCANLLLYQFSKMHALGPFPKSQCEFHRNANLVRIRFWDKFSKPCSLSWYSTGMRNSHFLFKGRVLIFKC
ncbi:hypothetical protein AAG906_008140 [Vitis piasezkii]